MFHGPDGQAASILVLVILGLAVLVLRVAKDGACGNLAHWKVVEGRLLLLLSLAFLGWSIIILHYFKVINKLRLFLAIIHFFKAYTHLWQRS